jgi:hypothetical protein
MDENRIGLICGVSYLLTREQERRFFEGNKNGYTGNNTWQLYLLLTWNL